MARSGLGLQTTTATSAFVCVGQVVRTHTTNLEPTVQIRTLAPAYPHKNHGTNDDGNVEPKV